MFPIALIGFTPGIASTLPATATVPIVTWLLGWRFEQTSWSTTTYRVDDDLRLTVPAPVRLPHEIHDIAIGDIVWPPIYRDTSWIMAAYRIVQYTRIDFNSLDLPRPSPLAWYGSGRTELP